MRSRCSELRSHRVSRNGHPQEPPPLFAALKAASPIRPDLPRLLTGRVCPRYTDGRARNRHPGYVYDATTHPRHDSRRCGETPREGHRGEESEKLAELRTPHKVWLN